MFAWWGRCVKATAVMCEWILKPACSALRSGFPWGTYLHLLLPVLGRVLAALALPAQLLQLRLALLQTLPFALVLHLVLLQRRL